MRKWLLSLVFLTAASFAQQPVEISYNEVNQVFQEKLNQIFQNFVAGQEAQGNQVVVSFYDNLGEVRVTQGTARAPCYLRGISNYKVEFMRKRQLFSTQGVFYVGVYGGHEVF